MRRNKHRSTQNPTPMLLDVLDADLPEDAGAKALRLRWLGDNDARVPVTFVVPASITGGISSESEALIASLQRVLKFDVSYAVRSSATLEDGTQRSMAGQFLTVLDVDTPDGIAHAIRDVIASADTVPNAGDMGVIVQEMVRPVLSGVSFSRNPMTGLSDVVVEAIEGRGDLLLQDGSDPLRWVDRWGTLVDRPSTGDFDSVIADVIGETRRLAKAFGSPVDLEWVWDGTEIWWVQARPITGLGALPVYSRRIAKEVLPGMIKPLVWSINVPLVNRAWIRLFTEFAGPNDLDPGDLAKSIGYRAYFDMRPIGDIFEMLGMPRDSLEGLLGLPGVDGPSFRPSFAVMRKLPRMAVALIKKVGFATRTKAELRTLDQEFGAYDLLDPATLEDAQLVASVDRLIERGTDAAYHNIVTPLFANALRGLLTRRLAVRDLDLHAIDLGGGDDGTPGPDFERLATALRETGDGFDLDSDPAMWPEPLRSELQRFLARHGHLSENANDLSVPRWREDPRLVVRLAGSYVGRSSNALPWDRVRERLPTISRPVLDGLRHRTITYERLRNEVSSAYTRGYGTLRPLLLDVGRRLVQQDVLGSIDDIYYLEYGELKAGLLSGAGRDLRRLVEERRADMERFREVSVPEIVYGDDWLPVPEHPGLHLRGIGTSRGQRRGKAVAVRTLAEGDRLEAGDVLVVPHSDVAWTPLFSRAGAVVAESGGMLAHSSIVAREVGIPAVASVADACRLLDGRHVLVDGYTGDVYIEENVPR